MNEQPRPLFYVLPSWIQPPGWPMGPSASSPCDSITLHLSKSEDWAPFVLPLPLPRHLSFQLPPYSQTPGPLVWGCASLCPHPLILDLAPASRSQE